ncbi:hypothetical protein LCGC14_0448890 [marine sediment metagenome]|uniref:Uncharacterized protein n=1 Tax=marine sediment metagenome TaxID=412755 RepID=A0A0F9VSF5_9ZZZZ
MADLYLSLNHNQYKKLEEQLRNFKNIETTHTTVDQRFYHKAFRLDMGDLVLEIQGPRVMAPPIAEGVIEPMNPDDSIPKR